ncbi:MAG: LLM class flavin-dependent oxidoreductase [Alphaproteobacteria bacterium]|nr:MAG: LLM class flavin-dependent oxidoreductase [Alphaproteobacteria bacterium]
MELWHQDVSSPRGIMHVARRIEADGWDGLSVVDSQNLSGDCYVALAMAATVTERIGLGTGVTNSGTRQAAVTAMAIASVQSVSRGRAYLGIGRGDSAMAHLGRSPTKVAQFEQYLRHVQTYLRAEAVPFDEIDIPDHIAPPLSALHLASAPPHSQITALTGKQKVPVEVAASGPKVIAVGAVHADRVMFTVGADTDRLAWGIELARKARTEAGLDPGDIAFGAFINCASHPDKQVAHNLVRGGLTTFARFSVMHGKTSGPLKGDQEQVLNNLIHAYDMKKHTHGDSLQAETLTPDFIDQFAIVGDADHCIERLRSLRALGLDKVIISGIGRAGSTPESEAANALFVREVLPAMKASKE